MTDCFRSSASPLYPLISICCDWLQTLTSDALISEDFQRLLINLCSIFIEIDLIWSNPVSAPISGSIHVRIVRNTSSLVCGSARTNFVAMTAELRARQNEKGFSNRSCPSFSKHTNSGNSWWSSGKTFVRIVVALVSWPAGRLVDPYSKQSQVRRYTLERSIRKRSLADVESNPEAALNSPSIFSG